MQTTLSRFLNRLVRTYDKSSILIDSISSDRAQSDLAFARLLLLRWGALACQALLVAGVFIFFETRTPLPILLLIIIFGGGTNIAFQYFYSTKNKAMPEGIFALAMFLDIILLTALLHYTGGPMNPFTFLFLIHISLGAILMRPAWAWSLAIFTTLCYAGLFFLPKPIAAAPITQNQGTFPCVCQVGPFSGDLLHDNMSLHLQGMWLAFAITVVFVVFFINKIQKDLEQHQKTLAELEVEKNRSEKLASLATLAAGAAHEFSTPLSTIAVAAGEVLTTLKKQPQDPELIDDIQLIRRQVERCREILYNMSADAGEHMAESLRVFSIGELRGEVFSWFTEAERKRIVVDCREKNLTIRMPFRTLKRIIRGLLKNALDASSDEQPVYICCRKDHHHLFFEVSDQGTGMDQQTLARAVEPFFTTKEPGKGLGLGLFLAKSAAERMGGTLEITSAPGKGTTVTINFALNQILPDGGTDADTNHQHGESHESFFTPRG
jgi:two-component system sensor histidine kinase RegB